MNREQARELIKRTFEAPFDKGKFTVFIENLLNKIEEAGFIYRGNFIPDAFEHYISTLERIGKYTEGENEIDLLIVKLGKKTSLERARTMQRNFIAWYLKGSRGGKLKDAALVAFVSPNEDDWRFSLVKMDYRFEEGKAGRMKVKEEFTPAHRWSFLVGINEKSHTAQSRLVPILENDEHNPTLTELEEAFNIEPVTKEFFEKYRDLFIRTVDELDKIVKKNEKVRKDFELKNINTIDFAKKLLGQIVFLYFLQKKGWFGVKRDAKWGTGPKDFLRQLFEKKHGDYKNFFNDVLEPLFYEALAWERDDNFYSRFNCKIPFLNGGLFEPVGGYDWVHIDINLTNGLFSNKNNNYEGDGVLDIFDLFNFTVKEDEPLEKEVAIDPELLGKSYEKFNAIRSDNFYDYKRALSNGKKTVEKKFNKQYGVYYTPREIVHYMCQQSLINYLYTELNQGGVAYEKLSEKQLYAFRDIGERGQYELMVKHTSVPTVRKEDIETLIKYGEQFAENEAVVEEKGKETKTYKYELPETIRKNAKIIDEKLKNIKVCDPAVGSGAFPVGMMTEIVKARDVLSPFLSLKGTKATKQSQTGDRFSNVYDANRTIYKFKSDCIEKSLYGVDIDPGACEIAKLRLWLSLVVDEEYITPIKPLPNLDYKIVCGNSLLGFPENWGSPIEKEIEALMDEYFSVTNSEKKRLLKTKIDEKIKSRYATSEKMFGYKINFDFKTVFSKVFREKGGFDVVIANPPYVEYRKIQKEIIKYLSHYKLNTESSRPNLYMYFIEKGFYILKPKGIFIFINPNQFLSTNAGFGLRKFLLKNTIIKFIVDVSYIKVFQEVATYTSIWLFIKEKKDNYKICINRCNNLSKLGVISLSINKKYILNDSSLIIPIHSNYNLLLKIEDKYLCLGQLCKMVWGTSQSGYGKLKICKPEFSKLSDSNKKKYAPILQTSDIKRYYIDWQGEYIPKNIFSNNIKKIFGYEKILIARVTRRLQCAVDINRRFVGKSTIIFNYNIDKNCLLAVLNSKVVNYWYSKKFETVHMASGYLRFDIPYLKKIPIPQIPEPKQKSFIDLVDGILSLTQSEDYFENTQKQAKVNEYERQIDQLVYKLYGLTKEEIKIVEGSVE